VCKELEEDIQQDDQFDENVLEGYSALACILIQKGCKMKFMKEKKFVKEVEKMNKEVFKNVEIVIYGNWPLLFRNLAQSYQNLENLCTFGIKIFPSPNEVLFVANKHR
jgi:hypothetical protein